MSNSSLSRILVVGDVMLDVYTSGVAERVSPEAPVMVLKAEQEETRLGGAGAVAALLAVLEVQPVLAGVVGDDQAGATVRRLLDDLRREANTCPVRSFAIECDVRPLVTSPDRPTTMKERLIGKAAGRPGQPMLRIDRECCGPLPGVVDDELRAASLLAVDRVEAVLISDYGKGVCSAKLLKAIIRFACRKKLPVLVDPCRGGDYERYRGATLIKANRHETAAAVGREIRRPAEAFMAGNELCAHWGFRAAVITLDADGMVLVTMDGKQEHFRTPAKELVDVCGAGDTVLATLGAALVRKIDLPRACRLASAAAAIQVERRGVAPISWAELNERIAAHAIPEGDERNAAQTGASKVVIEPHGATTIEALVSLVADHRARGRKIVFTNGCFDMLHPGHVHCLQAAKALGDVLIVAVNSDASVRRLKGASRPVIGEQQRATMLAALACVDHVVLFDGDTPEELIERLRPDVLVKGAEQRLGRLPGEEIVASYGGQVELVPLLAGVSTTGIVARLQSQASFALR
jgi:D-beta-D-heptose 7-phosphate kinase/D-beta-D-heptose 1-phosphate adenosyltransferase